MSAVNGLCGACAHWRDDGAKVTGLSSPLGKCQKIVMFWDATEWSEDDDDDGRRLKKGFEDAKAFAQDGSDYIAYLKTTADFGCVMFKGKL